MEGRVRFEKLGGRIYIGHAVIDNPSRLNAINDAMARSMLAQLPLWQQDPHCAGLLISGAGTRGFCAGGDVKQPAIALENEDSAAHHKRASDFFAQEYRLDHCVWRFDKPTIALTHGITMGGGLGLMQACEFRLLSPNSKLAMPEVAIGFVPDAGASWFLNRVRYGLGEIIGISGMHLGMDEALALELADAAVDQSAHAAFIQALNQADFSDNQATNRQTIANIVNKFRLANRDRNPIEDHHNQLQDIRYLPSLQQRFAALCQLSNDLDPWLQKIGNTALKASPTSVVAFSTLLRHNRFLSLSECFDNESKMASYLHLHGDFLEGVRAVLIDKDNAPRWRHAAIDAVEQKRIVEALQ